VDENRIKGAVRSVEGKIERKLEQGAGKVQSGFGKAMDELPFVY
jgi:uncharacterized protein YjbJ (UPF0337 family)